MPAFLEGAFAGYGVAIPVGAIAILIIDMGLRHGFALAFMAGAGAASADLIYVMLAAVSGEALALALKPYAVALRLLSALVLFAIGSYGLWRLRQRNLSGDKTQALNQRGRWQTYTRFLGLTLLNPLTIAYFAALILGRSGNLAFSAIDRVLFVVGAALASLSWQTFIAALGALAHRHLSPRIQLFTSLLGNLIVIGLGLRILLV